MNWPNWQTLDSFSSCSSSAMLEISLNWKIVLHLSFSFSLTLNTQLNAAVEFKICIDKCSTHPYIHPWNRKFVVGRRSNFIFEILSIAFLCCYSFCHWIIYGVRTMTAYNLFCFGFDSVFRQFHGSIQWYGSFCSFHA